ncbi:MAG: hypothetical protein EP330_26280 [Deltaproteobacteria bacterium]|nr:MAG: hypothetical protein EP330_26280 [Deltaproteobacteria bacterium]
MSRPLKGRARGRLAGLVLGLLLASTASAETAVQCDELETSTTSAGHASLVCVRVAKVGCDVRVENRCAYAVQVEDSVQTSWGGPLPSGESAYLWPGDWVITVTRPDDATVRRTLRARVGVEYSMPHDSEERPPDDLYGRGCSTSPGLSWMGLLVLFVMRRVRR